MAAELTRFGVSVRIIDKAAKRTDKSKALVMWSRTVELIDRMGCGSTFLASGCRTSNVTVVAGSKRIGSIALDGLETPHPYALMIPQSETERLLEQHLDSLGVRIERSVELVKFTETNNQVAASLRLEDGSEESTVSSWLIGCDGAHSTVRHQLGLTFSGRTLKSSWILADVGLRGDSVPGGFEIGWHSDGALAIFLVSPDRYRIIANAGTSRDGATRSDPTLEEVQALLDRRGPGGIVAHDPTWLSSYVINERIVDRYRSGRCFLAGDSAHIHSPAGGQGMNTGIQDACNLAWKLALICRGVCEPEPLLGSYNTERRAVGKRVVSDTGKITALAVLRGAIPQAVRNRVAPLVFNLPPVVKKIAAKMAEISIGYPRSPLTEPSLQFFGGPIPGSRAPIREGEAPVGSGDLPRFILFASPDDQSAALCEGYPDLLDPTFPKPFRVGGMWLVRPDGYVALVARQGDWRSVERYLRLLSATPVAVVSRRRPGN